MWNVSQKPENRTRSVDLFWAATHADPATKEALRYRTALYQGLSRCASGR